VLEARVPRVHVEDALIFDMLTTMDGNDSLKRVLRRERTSMAQDEMGEPTLAQSSERVDNRDAGDGYYISCEQVDRWAKSRLGDILLMQSGNNVSASLWSIGYGETVHLSAAVKLNRTRY